MNKVRVFIISTSALLSVWLVVSFITKVDTPIEVAELPITSSTITLYEVE